MCHGLSLTRIGLCLARCLPHLSLPAFLPMRINLASCRRLVESVQTILFCRTSSNLIARFAHLHRVSIRQDVPRGEETNGEIVFT